jgi:hypothetical protein
MSEKVGLTVFPAASFLSSTGGIKIQISLKASISKLD